MRYFSALAFALVFACLVSAQANFPELMAWSKHPDTGDQWNLIQKQFCDGKTCFPARQVGAFTPSDGLYREISKEGKWSEPKAPPIPPPAKQTGAVGQLPDDDGKKNFGVDPGKRAKRDKVTYQGREITQAEAHQILDGGNSYAVPDDASKPHLTIATKGAAEREKIERDLMAPEAAPLLERYRIQVYDASRKVDGEILKPFTLERDPRFQKDGTVCYLQEPQSEGASKVICAVGGWHGPAPLLAAVRSADPTWDPSKVSGPSLFGNFGGLSDLLKVHWSVWAAGALGLYVLLKNTPFGSKAAAAAGVIFRPWMVPPPPVVVVPPPTPPIVP